MSSGENVEEEGTLTEKTVAFDLEGHRIEVEAHQGLSANQYRLIVDGTKVDAVDKSMGTHKLRGELPAEAGGEPLHFEISLEGSFKNKIVLEYRGERQELSHGWVA